jgi:hypothetical protein
MRSSVSGSVAVAEAGDDQASGDKNQSTTKHAFLSFPLSTHQIRRRPAYHSGERSMRGWPRAGLRPEGEAAPRSVVESAAAGDSGKRGGARRGLLADRTRAGVSYGPEKVLPN